MARAVRKVSRATTKDQKKESKINKKLIIIIMSIVLVIGIGLGVGLGVYFGTKTEDTYVSDKIYFNEPVSIDATHSVTFNKENHQAIKRYLDSGNYAEDMFIFVYDGSAFYADEKDVDHYNKDYEELIQRLAHLQYTIDEAKASGKNVELYVVDVAVDNYVNVDILLDSTFGSLYSDEEALYEPAFIYFKSGEYKQKVEIEEKEHIISTANWADVLSSSILYAMNYIKTL